MIQKIKNQNKKPYAFTLIEMLIVLIVMGIMLMVTLYLSGDQIQKVKDKTVKESILAEMQSRYSRNLWSSSFAGTIYDHMDVTFSWWSNEISFSYYTGNISEESSEPFFTNQFIDKYTIRYITPNYDFNGNPQNQIPSITLQYKPYKISCSLEWEADDSYNNIVMVARVNDSRDYCFEINQKNCRLIEVSEEKCKILKNLINN